MRAKLDIPRRKHPGLYRPLAAGKTVRYLTVMPPRPTQQASYSRVSVKSQTVLPRDIRERLGIRPGDTIRYRLTTAGVLIDKAPAGDDDPFAAFSEWSGEADEKGYADL